MLKRFALILTIILTLTALPSCDMLGDLWENGGDNPPAEVTEGMEAFERHDPVISTPMTDDIAFIMVNNNEPDFTEADFNGGEYYIDLSDLDSLGRVQTVTALIDEAHMPDPEDERGEISSVTPTGWYTNGKSNNHQYDFVEAKYVYNRAHVLGFQLSGLNAEQRNLITGTRFFNIDGNLTYENIIADHLHEMDGTNGKPVHKVLIRVTPDFYGDNLVCHGEYYEADCMQCDDIDFSVYMYNKQPGVTIDYRTGENWANDGEAPVVDLPNEVAPEDAVYILNTESMKFHLPTCHNAPDEGSDNYYATDATREEIIDFGYDACGTCKP